MAVLAKDLRNAVLQAAFQGKLTKQLDTDSSVDEIIKIENNKDIGDIPYEIPNNWKFINMEDLTSIPIKRGKSPKYVNKSSIIVFAQKCNKKTGEILLDEAKYLDEKIKNKYDQSNFLQANDIVINSTGGGTMGRVGFIKQEIINESLPIVPDSHITTIRTKNNISPKYIYYFLKFNQPYLESSGVGSTNQTELKPDIIKKIVVPLPPIEEQQRIVDKIEELMAKIDEYEKLENQLEELKKEFPNDMKDALLQAAMQGKLTKQLDSDSSVDELLDLLKKEKEYLVKEKLIYKKKETPRFYDEDTLPFEIPSNWRWVKLSDVSIIQEGAGIRKYQYIDSGIQLFSVTNILEDGIDLEKKQLYVSFEEYENKYKHLTLNKGDIVTACSGGSWGKIAIYNEDDTVMLNTSTLRLRFFNDLANNKYLYYICKSEFFKKQLRSQLSGMQPNFGYLHYSKICFPLPPLEEQQRIVKKLDKLLPICKDLSEII